ncbi:uncharacterized protein I303_101273 [Kwoniella dejecticola CBS 10117]|uniref:Uncharacterized protein n=1 Tax=Kwoniella dejecticola CBS 10117 TaxID=1296121 RepID=A0A1A6AHB4_9TREE|nr:uncharacterized protein I303_01281 [Kwoniella dejecticola CBS 10117]OBR89454.1 hypothetical protein I303_01281 [Kwoniella dejecticola CBS 10117]
MSHHYQQAQYSDNNGGGYGNSYGNSYGGGYSDEPQGGNYGHGNGNYGGGGGNEITSLSYICTKTPL